MAAMTFEEIVKADFEIDAIVEYQAAMILSAGNLPGLAPRVRHAVRDAVISDIVARRAVALAHRSEQAGHLIRV
jgi:hypothetical protein